MEQSISERVSCSYDVDGGSQSVTMMEDEGYLLTLVLSLYRDLSTKVARFGSQSVHLEHSNERSL